MKAQQQWSFSFLYSVHWVENAFLEFLFKFNIVRIDLIESANRINNSQQFFRVGEQIFLRWSGRVGELIIFGAWKSTLSKVEIISIYLDSLIFPGDFFFVLRSPQISPNFVSSTDKSRQNHDLSLFFILRTEFEWNLDFP